jgi:hypothetical protein
MIEHIERLQQELAAIRAYQKGYLDRRAGHGITTETDSIMMQHQQTYAEVLDLLEAIKAEKISEAEGELR